MDTPIGLTGQLLIGATATPGSEAAVEGHRPRDRPGARSRRTAARAPPTSSAPARWPPPRSTPIARRRSRRARSSSRRSPTTSSRIGDALIVRAMQESGLPRARLEGERGRTMNQLKLFAEVVREGSWLEARIDPAMPDRKPLPRSDLRAAQRRRRPGRGVRREQLPARLLGRGRRHRLGARRRLPGHREGAPGASRHLRAGGPRGAGGGEGVRPARRRVLAALRRRATGSAARSSPIRASRPWASPARAAAAWR